MFTPLFVSHNVLSTIHLTRTFHMICRSGITLDCYRRTAQLTVVRYKKTPRRKPFWLPVAKTKLFRITEKKVIPEEELDQIRDLRSHYQAEMDSIMAYFAAENEKLEFKQQHDEMESNFSQLLMLNKEENERVKKIRESVLASEREAEKQALLEKDRLEKEWLAEKKEEVDNIIKYEKAQSVNFVNLENLEHAISEAIDNPVNYNFAIDLNGTILWDDLPQGSEASAFWTDDIPRQKLDKPPSQPRPVKFKKRRDAFVTERRWY